MIDCTCTSAHAYVRMRVVLPVRVEGSQDFRGFFVTARDSAGQAVGTMTTADAGHQTMCDDDKVKLQSRCVRRCQLCAVSEGTDRSLANFQLMCTLCMQSGQKKIIKKC